MKRKDIQGLRAVAVLLVIADHLLGFPSGGFVGVDVFFVLSGFLITGILVRERERTGRISFRGFYARRARRILPVAAVVLLVTVAASWLLFRSGRALLASTDAIWSLFFAANWRFALVGTDYMQAGGPISPVQHYWSLAVEEQFYLAWPWLILLAFAIAGRMKRVRPALYAVLAVAIVASLVWAFYETETAHTIAYFSTFSRAWELGVGAVLAVATVTLQRIPDRLRPFLAWAGLAGLFASVLRIQATSSFPAPWALAPVLATALVIAAGTGGNQRWLSPITNRVAGYLGDISYSLYLWHFPVIVLLGLVIVPHGLVFVGASSLLILGLSVASYHLLEDPIRNSNWLRPAADRRPAKQAGQRRRVLLIVAAVAVLSLTGAALVPVAATVARPPTVPADAPALTDVTEASLQSRMQLALSATSWPELDPSLDDLAASIAPEWQVQDCLDIDDSNLERCRYGASDAPRLAVLLGDSVAVSWMPGLRAALESEGFAIQSLTLGECPAVDVDATRFTHDDFTARCTAHHAWALDKVRVMKPDLVILSSAASTMTRLASGASGDAAIAEWRAGSTRTVTQLRSATDGAIVLLSSPPTVVNLQTCVTRVNRPADCLGTPEATYDGMVAADQDAIDSIEGAAAHIAPLSWFCTPQRECPAFIGSVPTFADTTHITAAYSRSLAPLLRDALLASIPAD